MTSPVVNIALSQMPSLSQKIGAIMLRHFYLYKQSWPRLLEMMYWPVLSMMCSGYVSLSIMHSFSHAEVVATVYLSGVLLNEVLVRNVMGILILYMEEVWSRNLGHLFASPLMLRDYTAALISICSLRTIVSLIPAFIVVFLLFHFSVLSLSWPLIPYIILLAMNGWWYGFMIVALLMRFGLAAEWLGWMCTGVLLPFMAPYYPISVLPKFMQFISYSLPGTYVFESMKQQMSGTGVNWPYLGIAFGLNIFYFVIAYLLLSKAFRHAKISGGLLQMGE